MSLWKRMKITAGGGSMTNQPSWIAQPDPLDIQRRAVAQQQAIEQAMLASGPRYSCNGGVGGNYVPLTPGNIYHVGGGNVHQNIQPIQPGGWVYLSTSATNTMSTSVYSGPQVKPLFDPQWFQDYLEAREEAVMERLSGD